MKKIYYTFISFTTILTIFITVLSSENSANIKNNSKYYWPTPSYTGISSKFGYRKAPTKGASSYHKGIDILAIEGTTIYAIEKGTVTFAGFSNSGGYMVIISHENGIVSRYAHMAEEILVPKGQKVQKGEQIGKVGPKYLKNGRLNGATTGVHLHLGISINEEFVNPLDFF